MIHSEIDIEGTDDGDLVLDQGDLKIATSSRSIMQAVMFLVLTDYGEYTPDPLAAGNLGSFIGSVNRSSIHAKMRGSIRYGLDQQGLIKTSNIGISVTPVSIDQALLTLRMPLVFIEKQQSDILTEPLVLGFVFPYESGKVELLSLPTIS